MRIFSLLFIFLLFPFVLFSQQNTIRGTVVDKNTKKPIPFVNIVYDDNNGVVSDIDGVFVINSGHKIDSLLFSCVGYEKTILSVEGKFSPVMMTPLSIFLDEIVVVAGINPALRIINNVVNNKKNNNPDLLDSYSYHSHDKMVFTIDNDSLTKQLERAPEDSSLIRVKQFSDEQHLFINESVVETKYRKPNKRSERVIAARTSGFNNPFFVFLISQMQSHSFYEDRISLSDKHYINPIANSAISKYIYLLSDTIVRNNSTDTTYIIKYLPKPNTNFDGLTGLLYINTNKWAIENVTAQPAVTDKSGVNISIEQKYEFIQGHWFPVQLSTKIMLPWIEANGAILIGKGKSYINDINLNVDLNGDKELGIALDVESDAYHQSEEVWTKYRQVPLTEKDLKTYHVIDSIGKEMHFDRKATGLESLMNGAIPVGKFDIMLDKLMHYNKHEGWFVGFGAGTNRRFSDYVIMQGALGYGFKDKEMKYSSSLSLFADKYRQQGIKISYSKDLHEPGDNIFDKNTKSLFEERYRELLLADMDFIEEYSLFFNNRLFTGLTSTIGVRKQEITSLYNYSYNFLGEEVSDYSVYEGELTLRFAFGEKLIRNVRSVVSMGTKYPMINMAFVKGIVENSSKDGDYIKMSTRVDYSFYTPFFGKTSLRIDGGIAKGDLPLSKLFNGKGSYGDFTLYAPNSFPTMRLNEFFADRYISTFLSHNFGKLLVDTKYFAPEIIITQNILIGDITDKDKHIGYDFKVPDEGYYESGLVFNNLLKLGFVGYGVGIFYRYGQYSLPKQGDNFAINISMRMVL